jgi:hypothetical protein
MIANLSLNIGPWNSFVTFDDNIFCLLNNLNNMSHIYTLCFPLHQIHTQKSRKFSNQRLDQNNDTFERLPHSVIISIFTRNLLAWTQIRSMYYRNRVVKNKIISFILRLGNLFCDCNAFALPFPVRFLLDAFRRRAIVFDVG